MPNPRHKLHLTTESSTTSATLVAVRTPQVTSAKQATKNTTTSMTITCMHCYIDA